MICPHCGMNEYKARMSPLNGLRVAVNVLLYALFLVLDQWEDPPCLTIRRKCGNCGLVTQREKDRQGLSRHCRACGYNLTGNVSGVCPECGERL